MFVPVVDKNQKPLMPTTPARAKKWIQSGKATPFWKHGVFCVRLNIEPSNRKMQEIVCGIDVGSKKEAYTIKSESHTFLNIECDAVTWVKDAVKRRREARRTRRNRKTPCRKPKFNNKSKPKMSPSTFTRWNLKLRIVNWLRKVFPISHYIVEDIKAKTMKNGGKWNLSFSPLEAGKNWFYSELEKLGDLELKQGWETKIFRDHYGLTKSKDKMSGKFECHCVDSWTLANWCVGGHVKPDNKEILYIKPLQFHRRQLHVFNFAKGGVRKLYGSTRSLGFKRGSIVRHIKYGICLIGGTSKNLISLHAITDSKRLCRNAKISDIKFLTFNSWRWAIS